MRNFNIVLVQEQPGQPFFTGSKVRGNLIVEVDEPKSYNYISVAFQGGANVHWTETTTYGSGRSRRREIHHYTSSETYVNLSITVWTKQGSANGKLGPGKFAFPFEFIIPSTAPSSFEGSVGMVRYEIQGRVGTGLLKFDHQVAAKIPVQQLVFVNLPELQQPIRCELRKTVCCLCCASGPIVITVDLPKTGYLIGEALPLRVSVENGSRRQIQLLLHLMQNVVYRAQGRTRFSSKAIAHASSNRGQIGGANTTQDWSPVITIPATDVSNEGSCHIIQIKYILKVVASIPWAANLTGTVPLKLGNVRRTC